MNALNTTIVTATAKLFDQAEQVSVSLAEQMMELGIGSRAEAKPYALAWAAAKYGVKVRTGQRGDGFDRSTRAGEAAHKAVQRVLNFIFPASDLPSKSNSQQDAVAKVLKMYANLTAAEKRRFEAAKAKL